MTKASYQRRLPLGVAMAVVLLAATAPALTAPQQDEIFSQVNAIPIPGSPLVSFDISWVDPVLKKYYLGDRSNKAVDVIDTTTNVFVTQFKPTSPSAPAGFVGFTGSNDTSGPDGVITVDNKELWVGDGMSRVWVMNATTGVALTLPGGVPNPIPTGIGANPAISL